MIWGRTYSHSRTCPRGQGCASAPHGTAVSGAGSEPHLTGNAADAFLCRNSSRAGAKGKLRETERGTNTSPVELEGAGWKISPRREKSLRPSLQTMSQGSKAREM